MSTIIGTTSIQEEAGYSITQDIYGLDVLTRNFHGPESDWVKFVRQHPDRSPDTTFKDYFLVSRSANQQRGSTIKPTLVYKGVPGASTGEFAVTQSQPTGNLVSKEVTVKLSDGSGRTIQIEYKAPSTTWNYAVGKEPTSPMHEGEMLKFDKQYQFVRKRGAIEFPVVFTTGGAYQLAILRRYNPMAYFVYAGIYCEEFTKKQEGVAWTVTERNDGIILSAEDASGLYGTAALKIDPGA